MDPRCSFRDVAGLVISTDAPAAADSYSKGIALLLTSAVDAEPFLRDAVTVDPRFALAWIALAVAVAAQGLEAECVRCGGRAATTLAGATRRERQHIEVIRLHLAGDRRRAAVLGREHLREYPADVLVAHALESRHPA